MPKPTGPAKPPRSSGSGSKQELGYLPPAPSICGHPLRALLPLDLLHIPRITLVVVERNQTKAVSDVLEQNCFASVVAWLQMVSSGP